MKRVLGYCAGFLLAAFVIFELLVMNILRLPGDTFSTTFQAAMQDKYDLLMATDSPKIILVGGSNLAFGIDADALSEATGYPVVNLGVEADFYYLFVNELAKANIQEGDIVLLGYEFYWFEQKRFTSLGVNHVMQAIDGRIELYRYIPASQWKSILGYMFSYAGSKPVVPTWSEYAVYSRSSFSDDGNQFIANLQESYSPREAWYYTIEEEISEGSRSYLRAFKEYVESRGASVYFIASPYCEGCITNEEMVDRVAAMEEEQIGIPYLSNTADYEFKAEEMYDSTWHCNAQGMQHRTELLIDDLTRAGLIKTN